MVTNIIVPSMGESISKATISKWYKKPGDEVKVNDLLLELETEKVSLEVNATSGGYLQEILCDSGNEVTVGQIIGNIDEQISVSKIETIEPAEITSTEKILSPAAQNIAIERNVDIDKLENGSGKNGRFTKNDIIAAASPGVSAVVSQDANQDNAGRETRQKMTKLRQTIAQRLKDSQNTAAILTTFNEVDMFEVIKLRGKYKEYFEKKYGTKLGFMSFFVKACTVALQELPNVNAQIQGDEIIYKHYYDIGVAVGTDHGLVVPILRDADQLHFSEIESMIADFAVKAKMGKLSMSDLTGGTFSISNGGVYGSMLSTPIINPPQSAILGMHKIQERPVAIDGQVVIRPMMYLALSYDHRIIDGKEAVTFLVKVKNLLEQPEKLLLET